MLPLPLAKAKERREQDQQAALSWLLMERFGAHSPCIMVEVGVYRGDTPARLLHDFPQLLYIGVDTWLPFGEDPPYESLIHARMMALKIAERFPLRMRLVSLPSTMAAQCVAKGSIDIVFIDAAHNYDAALTDISTWSDKVKEGGVVAVHDYEFQSGVKLAVDEWCSVSNRVVEEGYIGGTADVWWCVMGP